MHITTRFLDDLAHAINEHGFGPIQSDLEILAELAVRHDAGAFLAGILTDPAEPDVVRARAFARISSALRALPATMTTAA